MNIYFPGRSSSRAVFCSQPSPGRDQPGPAEQPIGSTSIPSALGTGRASYAGTPGFLSSENSSAPFTARQLEAARSALCERYGFWIKDNWLGQLAIALACRMSHHAISNFWDYFAMLKAELSGAELQILIEKLLNHETSFACTAQHFDALLKQVVPVLRTARAGQKWRIGSLGCATGEEVYSLAIFLREILTPEELANLEIIGIDVSRPALSAARQGIYPEFQLRDLSLAQRTRWFTPEGDKWRVHDDLRQQVRFYQHNLMSTLPFSRLDTIFCRNVLTCFKPKAVSWLMWEFHASLNPGGFLFLGHSESAFGHAELFAPVRASDTVFYRRIPSPPPIRG